VCACVRACARANISVYILFDYLIDSDETVLFTSPIVIILIDNIKINIYMINVYTKTKIKSGLEKY